MSLNRRAHSAAVALLRGDTPQSISVEGGTVTLDLTSLIEVLLANSEDLLSEVFGRPIDLPSTTDLSPEAAAAARQRIESAFGVTLPEDFGQIVVLRSDTLAALQDGVEMLDKGVIVVVVLALVLILATILLSVDRRRTLVQLGLGVFLAFLIARVATRAAARAIPDLAAEGNRAPVRTVVEGVLDTLIDATTFLFLAGLLVAIVAFLVGHPDWFAGIRRRFEGRTAATTGLGAWVSAHRDVVRFGGVVLAVIALALVELSWASVLWIVALLVAFELGVTYLAGRPQVATDGGPETAAP